MSALLIRDGTVATLGEKCRVLPHHDVLVEGDRIARIAPAGTVPAAGARAVEARGCVVLPGFINAHTHCYSALARGLGKATRSRDFRELLEHLWWRLDRALTLEDVYVSGLVTLVDAVRHGTTTLLDHHASNRAVRGSLTALARAVDAVGVRAALCYELTDRDGAEVTDDALVENTDLVCRCRCEPGPRLRAMFGIHASFTLSDGTLERLAAIAAGHDAGFHVHVAEAASDQQACLAEHGMRVVERLDRFGLLGERTLAAHGVHLDERERELLARTATAVVHCPQSNMNNAVGTADVLALLERGVLVGLGTDAMTNDMLGELRAALFVRHLAAADPSAGFAETCGLLLDGNRRIAARLWPGEGLGELREGGAADLALIAYHPPTRFDETTLAGHLVFGLSQATVETTVCAGRVLMEHGRLHLDVDEAEVAAEARARAEALWARF